MMKFVKFRLPYSSEYSILPFLVYDLKTTIKSLCKTGFYYVIQIQASVKFRVTSRWKDTDLWHLRANL